MLNTNVVNMRQIIHNYRFVIPKYQRPYSWEEKQMRDLWNDIYDAYLIRTDLTRSYEQRNHFLGSILTTNIPGEPESMQYIVDGQQRLTSLTIFAAALLDVFCQYAPKSEIFDLYFSDTPQVFIKLNEGNDYFRNTIIVPSRSANPQDARIKAFATNTPDSDVHTNIHDNFDEARNQILRFASNFPPAERPEKLGGIFSTFLDYVYLVRINVPTQSNIIRIFRTLNARGADLSSGDLAKSVIFESVLNNPAGLDQVSQLWNETFEQIDRDATDDPITNFLRHYFVSTQKYIAEKDLTSEIEKFLTRSILTEVPPAIDFMKRLKEEASFYNTILQDDSDDVVLNDTLIAIRECIGVTATYPAVLAAFTRWSRQPEKLRKVTRLIENFAFRYFQVEKNNSVENFEKFMNTVAKLIRENVDPIDDVRRLMKERSQDHIFVRDFGVAKFTKTPLIKYIFWRVENNPKIRLSMLLDKTSKVKAQLLLPKKPNTAFAKQDIDMDSVTQIGNYFVTASKVNATKDMRYVVDMPDVLLRKGQDTVAEAIRAVGIWNPRSIAARQESLSKIARVVWSLDIDI
jgi:uncharacterized protein with ParB-like and HNH nuclease domain